MCGSLRVLQGPTGPWGDSTTPGVMLAGDPAPVLAHEITPETEIAQSARLIVFVHLF